MPCVKFIRVIFTLTVELLGFNLESKRSSKRTARGKARSLSPSCFQKSKRIASSVGREMWCMSVVFLFSLVYQCPAFPSVQDAHWNIEQGTMNHVSGVSETPGHRTRSDHSSSLEDIPLQEEVIILKKWSCRLAHALCACKAPEQLLMASFLLE